MIYSIGFLIKFPDTGFIFDHWSGDEINGSKNSSETINIDSDKSVIAHFIQKQSKGVEIKLEETGNSFVENATQKAMQLSAITSYPVIADDSGLEVDALDGRPGIFSARYAGLDATDSRNNQKLISELESTPYEDRKARYRCVIALVWSDKKVYYEDGVCEGYIKLQSAGENGFGYDHIFFCQNIT